MKIIRLVIIGIALIVAVFAATSIENDPCKTITVNTGIEVYTEANAASNRLAVLEPNDVIYLCGE